jgi:hypothetical protein
VWRLAKPLREPNKDLPVRSRRRLSINTGNGFPRGDPQPADRFAGRGKIKLECVGFHLNRGLGSAAEESETGNTERFGSRVRSDGLGDGTPGRIRTLRGPRARERPA